MKRLKRTVRLESDPLNKWEYKVLKEVEGIQKEMVDEMIETILKENLPATRKRLHERFYNYYRSKFPSLPSRVIEGAYIVAGRMVKSFRERRKKGAG